MSVGAAPVFENGQQVHAVNGFGDMLIHAGSHAFVFVLIKGMGT